MNEAKASPAWEKQHPTALLLLEDGTKIYGKGFGKVGQVRGELCFNTALTGYEEILTDPSYQDQIVIFTFPHIGNVGTNQEDIEDLHPENKAGAVGAVMKAELGAASNYRAYEPLEIWLKKRGLIAIANVDTRALTSYIREKGALNAILCHEPSGNFNLKQLKSQLDNWQGLLAQDLAKDVSSSNPSHWTEKPWVWNEGYPQQDESLSESSFTKSDNSSAPLHVVVIDYGVKRNILRLLAKLNVKITIVPAKTSAEEIFALKPDGVFLSNGPGDPAATATYAVPVIQALLEKSIPLFGICLGHQLLALAMGGKTLKMHQGHHGANHPVKDHLTDKVEIVSMNHGFTVDMATLPDNVIETHISLFDKTNCGIALNDKPAFSVQYHPEASPGPQDSLYLFKRFYELMAKHKTIKPS